nr:hypothetical protein CFP56_08043 [Quercus suber]
MYRYVDIVPYQQLQIQIAIAPSAYIHALTPSLTGHPDSCWVRCGEILKRHTCPRRWNDKQSLCCKSRSARWSSEKRVQNLKFRLIMIADPMRTMTGPSCPYHPV